MALTTTPSELTATALTLTTAAQTNITSLGTLTGASFADNAKAIFGAGSDLQIYHDGSNSYIDDVTGSGTGDLYIKASDAVRVLTPTFVVNNAANNESLITAVEDGAAVLYYNGTARVSTSSAGVSITGDLTATTLNGTLATAAQANITSVGTLSALTVSGAATAGSLLTTGATASTAVDGTVVDRSGNTSRFVAGRSGGNYASLEMHVAGASGITKRFSIDYDSTTKLFAPNGTTEHLVVSSAGNVSITGDLTGTGDTKILATGDIGIGPRQGTATNGAVYIGGNTDNPFVTPVAIFSGDGKVGIGITSPSNSLVVSNGGAQGLEFNPVSGMDSGSDILSYNRSTSSYVPFTVYCSQLKFNVGSSPSLAMTINSNRDVLIGTDAAYDKLTVARTSPTQTAGMTLVNLQSGGYGSGITWEANRSDANNVQTAGRISVQGAAAWNSDANASSTFILQLRSANTLTNRLVVGHDGTFTGSASNDISDQRLKENINTITSPLEKIKALTGRTFTWKEKAKQPSGTKYGFIAQEVESVVSDLVNDQVGLLKIKEDESVLYEDLDSEEGAWSKSVQSTGIIPILVEAMKEQQALIETLQAEVAALKGA
jgi:hypothetical protein